MYVHVTLKTLFSISGFNNVNHAYLIPVQKQTSHLHRDTNLSVIDSLKRLAMSPLTSKDCKVFEDDDAHLSMSQQLTNTVERPPRQIVWRNVILFAILHALSAYAVLLIPHTRLATMIWTVVILILGQWGITMGAHRLWSHRSYQARWPLRLVLILLSCIAGQNDIIEWSRDHRAHHKYSETDSDPHNAKRGFFFSHMGWLLVRKHPNVKRDGKKIDLSDLYADPMLLWQRKFYKSLMITFNFVIPTIVPWYFWGESLLNAYLICSMARYCVSLHVTWLVNSLAHMWGMKPYDASINPVENILVAWATVGEGFHNYHHTFPNDYSTSEYGWALNMTTAVLDCLAFTGLVYNRKTMSPEVVRKRKERTGDGSKTFVVY